MARGIKRSLIKNIKSAKEGTLETQNKAQKKGLSDPKDEVSPLPSASSLPSSPPSPLASSAFTSGSGGVGSAWKAGALAQTQSDLDEARANFSKAILSGDYVLDIDPEMISDPIGSDRRADWMQQESFLSLVESIRENGQDLPVLVWPQDPDWQPDALDPKNLERVQFLLLAGRRRCEAARQLGRPVRAVLASQQGRSGLESTFTMLVLRFRENEKRDDLSTFERLLSIGQMYEELKAASTTKITAKAFGERLGVHESMVSRARAVYKAKEAILARFKNVYEMSFQDFQTALARLSEDDEKKQAKKQADKPPEKLMKSLKVTRKIGKRNLLLETKGGTLSIKTSGVDLNKKKLEDLSDLIARYLGEATLEKKPD